MKNDKAMKKSNAKSRVAHEKCNMISIHKGRISKPSHVSLNDVMNYIENADKRETKIIYSYSKRHQTAIYIN
ncbi:MAG: hypothetical protein LBE11_03835 [Prevotellaceae bacterium]|nr:hypothetical protein [Prevotellaceae bacterium]